MCTNHLQVPLFSECFCSTASSGPYMGHSLSCWPRLWFFLQCRWLQHRATEELTQSTCCSCQPWVCCWSEQPLLSAGVNDQVLEMTVPTADFQCGLCINSFCFILVILLPSSWFYVPYCWLQLKPNSNSFMLLHANIFISACAHVEVQRTGYKEIGIYFKLTVFLRKAVEQNVFREISFQCFSDVLVLNSCWQWCSW